MITKALIIACSLGLYNPTIEIMQQTQPLAGWNICVDAGHGGQDPFDSRYTGGTWGVYTRQTEGEVNLNVSQTLKYYLEVMGAKVVMTRNNECRLTEDSNKSKELSIRAEIANDNKSNLFISIHHNDSNKPDVNYSLLFYNKVPESKVCAKWVSMFIGKDSRLPNLGVCYGNFAVLNRAQMPSILVEASFMSNPCQDYRLAATCVDLNGRMRMPFIEAEAWSIAKGVAFYAMSQKMMHGMSPILVKQDGKCCPKEPKPKKVKRSKKRH